MYCGAHQLNIVNGKTIAAIVHEGSDWLKKLHGVIKWLRKQANFRNASDPNPHTTLRCARNLLKTFWHGVGRARKMCLLIAWWWTTRSPMMLSGGWC
jgi:type IV secretory pathway TrbD component